MTTMAIVNLLSIFSLQHQESLLISKLNNFFNFDHNYFLLDSSTDFNRFLKMTGKEESTPQSLKIYKVADDITFEMVKEIKSKNTFLVVVSANVNFERNLNLLKQLKEIQRLQINMKIGIFFIQSASGDDLQKLFEWCWKHWIINIFVAFSEGMQYSRSKGFLKIFTYNPFGTFNVINLTGSEVFDQFFLSQKSNFHQYPIRFQGGSADEDEWRDVRRVMNASMTKNYENLFNYPDSSIDIFFGTFLKETNRVIIQPFRRKELVVVVPEALPYSEFAGFILTATSDNIFAYILITIAFITVLLTFVRYLQKKKILFFQSVADVFNLLMNDDSAIKYQRLYPSEIFLIVPLTFVGFVIVNGILSALQSHLTRPFIQPQINTIEDIYKSKLPIITFEKAYAEDLIELLEVLSPHGDWREQIPSRDDYSYLRQMTSYNRSMSFLVPVSIANDLLFVQKELNIKGYHITQLRSFTKYIIPRINPDFPFADRISEIFTWFVDAGFMDKKERRLYNGARNNYFQLNVFLKRDEDVEKFVAPMFIVYGWLVSVIVFLMEIFWKKFKLLEV